jgi:hypothetical protein
VAEKYPTSETLCLKIHSWEVRIIIARFIIVTYNTATKCMVGNLRKKLLFICSEAGKGPNIYVKIKVDCFCVILF